jgi:hypothetical protein
VPSGRVAVTQPVAMHADSVHAVGAAHALDWHRPAEQIPEQPPPEQVVPSSAGVEPQEPSGYWKSIVQGLPSSQQFVPQ